MDDEEYSFEDLQEIAQEVFDDLLETGGHDAAVATLLSILGQWSAETATVGRLADHMQATIDVAIEVQASVGRTLQ